MLFSSETVKNVRDDVFDSVVDTVWLYTGAAGVMSTIACFTSCSSFPLRFLVDHKPSLKMYTTGRPICWFAQLIGAYRMFY